MDPEDAMHDSESDDVPSSDEAADTDLEDFGDSDEPFFIKDKDVLTCSCGHLLRPPVKQCISGHLLCFNCNQGYLNCMICPAPNVLFSAPKVDIMLRSVLDNCPFKSLGCPTQYAYFERDTHLTNCSYSKLRCPIANCLHQEPARSSMVNHLITHHPDQTTFIRFGIRVPFSFSMDSEIRVFIENEAKYIFVLHSNVLNQSTDFKFYSIGFINKGLLRLSVLDRSGGYQFIKHSKILTTTLKDGDELIEDMGSFANQMRPSTYPSTIDCMLLVELAQLTGL